MIMIIRWRLTCFVLIFVKIFGLLEKISVEAFDANSANLENDKNIELLNSILGNEQDDTELLLIKQIVVEKLDSRIRDLGDTLPLFQTNKNGTAISHRTALKNVTQCTTDLQNLLASSSEKWFLPLIDSFGKPSSGISKGAVFWPGDFDQCQSIRSPKTDLFPNGFIGQYCLMNFGIQVIFASLASGICVPNSCGTAELNENQATLANVLSEIENIKIFGDKPPKISFDCLPATLSLSSSAITCIVFLALVFGLTAIGTLFDLKNSYDSPHVNVPSLELAANTDVNNDILNAENGSKEVIAIKNTTVTVNIVEDFLLCFSAIRNIRAVLDTTERKGQLNCLHGIRVISMTWIILGHTYDFGMNEFANVKEFLTLLEFSWSFNAVTNGQFAVDTFFLLSGFLITYLFLKERSAFNIKKLGPLYLHRYIRLTPVYMAVVFFHGTLFTFLGDGPFWRYADQTENLCTQYWWRNVLYIQNLFPTDEMCVPWSWYLANDMQFFLISPIFLILLKSTQRTRRMIGLSVLLFLILVSWVSTGLISILKHFPVSLYHIVSSTDLEKAMAIEQDINDEIYNKPWSRIGPYLIGCLLGTVVVRLGNGSRVVRRTFALGGWCVAAALSLSVVYGLYHNPLGVISSAFYNSLSRSCWAVAVAWVIFACLGRNGGFINKLLSWRFWFPLSRLTYCAYLVHPLIMLFYYQSLRMPPLLSTSNTIVHYLGFTFLTYALALVTSVAFEAPVIKLEKLVHQRLSR